MKTKLLTIGLLVLLVVSAIPVAVAASPARGAGQADRDQLDRNGAVYTEDNAVSNNVWMFPRFNDGTLGSGVSFSTGGSGTGSAFHSQGAVVLSSDGNWLLAVDAGSNEITVFRVTSTGLTMTDRVGSMGTMPISVTVENGWVYVLNQASLNIAGFTLSPSGELTPIPGSDLPLNGLASVPEQIGFSSRNDGAILAVTEKGSNQIDTYTVDRMGVPTGPTTTSSNGNGPYGFAFNNMGVLVDSEAASHAVSSYSVSSLGALSVISGSVPTGVAADTPCWVAITNNGKFAYTGNADTAISSYGIANDGSLTLIQENAGTLASGGALDLAFSQGSDYLYVLNAAGSISGFGVKKSDGGLTPVTTAPGVPLSAAGLAAS